jgi:archaellum component FlaG (FlaF/FlaG flagellin family)
MGFSTVTAQVMFFIAVIAVSAGLIAVFGTYIDQAKGAMSDKQQYLMGQLRTDVAITNVYNGSGHLYVFVKNIGKQDLKTGCLELYVDNYYVTLGAAQIVAPSTGAATSDWPPEATIELKPTSATLGSGSVHEAKVVTCNGVWDSENF